MGFLPLCRLDILIRLIFFNLTPDKTVTSARLGREIFICDNLLHLSRINAVLHTILSIHPVFDAAFINKQGAVFKSTLFETTQPHFNIGPRTVFDTLDSLVQTCVICREAAALVEVRWKRALS